MVHPDREKSFLVPERDASGVRRPSNHRAHRATSVFVSFCDVIVSFARHTAKASIARSAVGMFSSLRRRSKFVVTGLKLMTLRAETSYQQLPRCSNCSLLFVQITKLRIRARRCIRAFANFKLRQHRLLLVVEFCADVENRFHRENSRNALGANGRSPYALRFECVSFDA